MYIMFNYGLECFRLGTPLAVVEEIQVRRDSDSVVGHELRRALYRLGAEARPAAVDRRLEQPSPSVFDRQRELRVREPRAEIERAEADEPKRPEIGDAVEQRQARGEELRRDVRRRAQQSLPRDDTKVGPFQLDPDAARTTCASPQARCDGFGRAAQIGLDFRARVDVGLERALGAQPARLSRARDAAKI